MNRIKQAIKKLFTRKLVVINTQETQLIVVEVDKDCNSLVQGLGMDEDRARYLEKLVNVAFATHNNSIAAIADVSQHCKHANELFFCATVLTHRMRDTQGPGGFIQELLRRGKP